MRSPRSAQDLVGDEGPAPPADSIRSGFSLVEMVVVLVIVGVLAATAGPRFFSLSNLEASRAVLAARDDLRHAQRLAHASGCPVQVDFLPDRYVLNQRSGCRTGTFTLGVIDPVTNRAPFIVPMPTGVTASSTLDPLVFDEDGRATDATGLVRDATIRIGGGRLEASGATGLVRVP